MGKITFVLYHKLYKHHEAVRENDRRSDKAMLKKNMLHRNDHKDGAEGEKDPE